MLAEWPAKLVDSILTNYIIMS